MAKYRLKKGGVVNNETDINIPENIDNRDWCDYLKWSENNTPDPDPTQTQEEIDKRAEEDQRKDDISNEIESSGLRKITVAQAHGKIDQIFEDVTTVAALRAATVTALKKIIPFII
jgi:hypothetical protein